MNLAEEEWKCNDGDQPLEMLACEKLERAEKRGRAKSSSLCSRRFPDRDSSTVPSDHSYDPFGSAFVIASISKVDPAHGLIHFPDLFLPFFMSSPVLQVSHLVKKFGELTPVDGISFEIRKGEILGLLGANGAGKTTAINMVLGIVTPTSGEIRVFGKDLARERIAILRRMNFCSTYTQLPGNLLVWQNLSVFGRIYQVPNLNSRIDEVLEMLEILHLKDRVSGHLSAGESTRLNLCKALLNKPELLLLDEPTASLDPDIADKVRKVTRRIREEEGASILYTSHNMRDVEEVCDRVVFMHQGKILFVGTAREILSHFKEESLESLFIRVARSGEIEARAAV